MTLTPVEKREHGLATSSTGMGLSFARFRYIVEVS